MKRLLIALMAVLLLAATSATWASCPEGEQESQRTGNCRAIPGWTGTGLNFDGEWSGLAQCQLLGSEGSFRPRRVFVKISGGQVTKVGTTELGEKLYAKVGYGRLKIWGKYYAKNWKDINFSGKLYNDNARLTGKRGPRQCVIKLTVGESAASTRNIWCATADKVRFITEQDCSELDGEAQPF